MKIVFNGKPRLNLVIDIVYVTPLTKRCDLVLKSRKDEKISVSIQADIGKKDEGSRYY